MESNTKWIFEDGRTRWHAKLAHDRETDGPFKNPSVASSVVSNEHLDWGIVISPRESERAIGAKLYSQARTLTPYEGECIQVGGLGIVSCRLNVISSSIRRNCSRGGLAFNNPQRSQSGPQRTESYDNNGPVRQGFWIKPSLPKSFMGIFLGGVWFYCGLYLAWRGGERRYSGFWWGLFAFLSMLFGAILAAWGLITAVSDLVGAAV